MAKAREPGGSISRGGLLQLAFSIPPQIRFPRGSNLLWHWLDEGPVPYHKSRGVGISAFSAGYELLLSATTGPNAQLLKSDVLEAWGSFAHNLSLKMTPVSPTWWTFFFSKLKLIAKAQWAYRVHTELKMRVQAKDRTQVIKQSWVRVSDWWK